MDEELQQQAVTGGSVMGDPDWNEDDEFWDPVEQCWTRVG